MLFDVLINPRQQRVPHPMNRFPSLGKITTVTRRSTIPLNPRAANRNRCAATTIAIPSSGPPSKPCQATTMPAGARHPHLGGLLADQRIRAALSQARIPGQRLSKAASTLQSCTALSTASSNARCRPDHLRRSRWGPGSPGDTQPPSGLAVAWAARCPRRTGSIYRLARYPARRSCRRR